MTVVQHGGHFNTDSDRLILKQYIKGTKGAVFKTHLPYSPQGPLWKNVPVRNTATSDHYQDHITELLG